MTKEQREETTVKKCSICGCLLPKYHTGANICECCQDDIDEDNPHRSWERGVDIGDD